jgi:hypothetical protein
VAVAPLTAVSGAVVTGPTAWQPAITKITQARLKSKYRIALLLSESVLLNTITKSAALLLLPKRNGLLGGDYAMKV